MGIVFAQFDNIEVTYDYYKEKAGRQEEKQQGNSRRSWGTEEKEQLGNRTAARGLLYQTMLGLCFRQGNERSFTS